MTAIITTLGSIYEGTLFIDNMILFMKEKRTIVPSLPAPRTPTRHSGHRIEVKNVSFSYPGSERKVLKNINLTLEPGETAVLVGLNGAGKDYADQAPHKALRSHRGRNFAGRA